LRAWIAVFWPSERPGLELTKAGKHLVLLLNSIPWLLIEVLGPDLVGVVAEVGVGGNEVLVGSVFPHPGLAEHHDVVTSTEWVGVESDGLQNDL